MSGVAEEGLAVAGLKGPPAPLGKGVGKKGKAVPPPPAALSRRLGKGLSARFVDPPTDLRPPSSSKLLMQRECLRSAKGTLWEGLNMWDAKGHGVLEACVIDYDRLRRMWDPMPVPQQRPREPRRPCLLPTQILWPAEIAVKAAKLTPELLRRGLTEDMSCLNADQARSAHDVLARAIHESDFVAKRLKVFVAENGDSSLSCTEGCMWTLLSTPNGLSRARLLAECHRIEEDVAHVQDALTSLHRVLRNLRTSRPLKTLFQTILFIRNVLGQKGCVGFHVDSFHGIGAERVPRRAPAALDADGRPLPVDIEWLRVLSPSVLMLVAETLEATHVKRCRLRFLRMMVVGRLLAEDSPKRLVWSFLDDLQESPRDAAAVLAGLDWRLFDGELERSMRLMAGKYRRLRAEEVRWMATQEAGLNEEQTHERCELYEEQIKELDARMGMALDLCENGVNELCDAARQVCRLAGDRVADPQLAQREAYERFLALRRLGRELGTAMAEVSRRHRREWARMHRLADTRGKEVRSWQPVSTADSALMVTRDPVIVRDLRGVAAGWKQAAEREDVREAREVEQQDKLPPMPLYIDLVHGGAPGVYCRDPVTGKWGSRLDGVDGTCPKDLKLGGPKPDA